MDLNKEYQCFSCTRYGNGDGTKGHNCKRSNMYPKNICDSEECPIYERTTKETAYKPSYFNYKVYAG